MSVIPYEGKRLVLVAPVSLHLASSVRCYKEMFTAQPDSSGHAAPVVPRLTLNASPRNRAARGSPICLVHFHFREDVGWDWEGQCEK